MKIIDAIKGGITLDQIANRLSISADKAEHFLRLFDKELEEYVKKTICSLGLEQVNEENERIEISEKLVVAVGEAIPPPYSLAWPILKPFVRTIVGKVIEDAVAQGAKYCQNVECAILPIRIII